MTLSLKASRSSGVRNSFMMTGMVLGSASSFLTSPILLLRDRSDLSSINRAGPPKEAESFKLFTSGSAAFLLDISCSSSIVML